MKLRLALASVAGVAALAPAVPAHALECNPLVGIVCSTYGTACRDLYPYVTCIVH